jgi:hypothetical protein
MVDFAKDWGSFLNTEDSLTRESLESFYEAIFRCNVQYFQICIEEIGFLFEE